MELELERVREQMHGLGWLDEGGREQAQAVLDMVPAFDALVEAAREVLR